MNMSRLRNCCLAIGAAALTGLAAACNDTSKPPAPSDTTTPMHGEMMSPSTSMSMPEMTHPSASMLMGR